MSWKKKQARSTATPHLLSTYQHASNMASVTHQAFREYPCFIVFSSWDIWASELAAFCHIPSASPIAGGSIFQRLLPFPPTAVFGRTHLSGGWSIITWHHRGGVRWCASYDHQWKIVIRVGSPAAVESVWAFGPDVYVTKPSISPVLCLQACCWWWASCSTLLVGDRRRWSATAAPRRPPFGRLDVPLAGRSTQRSEARWQPSYAPSCLRRRRLLPLAIRFRRRSRRGRVWSACSETLGTLATSRKYMSCASRWKFLLSNFLCYSLHKISLICGED